MRKMRFLALAAVAGGMLPIFGCVSGLFSNLLSNGISYGALEFLLDNDGIFDLFQD
jgi:hypothetical protein